MLNDEIPTETLKKVSHSELIDLLNQDLSLEYQSIVGYVVYSHALKGAGFMPVAGELENYVARELNHALIIGDQVDYLAGAPEDHARALSTSKKAIEMLRWNFESGKTIIRNYSERIRQCEELQEYAMGEQIRGILIDKQIHQVALAAALGKTVLPELQNA